MSDPIRLLTFDLDDTLWPSAPVLAGAEAAIYRFLEAQAPALCSAYSLEDMREHRLALLQRQPELRHEISRWRITSLIELLREAGYSVSEAEQVARRAFAVFIQARHQVEYFREVEAVLAQLASRYTLAALTNGNADVYRLSVGQHFAFALRAEELKSSKPDPAMFLAALQRARCRPDQAIHIGDHPDYDIAGARAAGMHALQARLLPDNHPAMAPAFSHWRELPALVAAAGN